MITVLRISFFIGLFIFILSYFIDPYKINDGNYIVIDEDVVSFLKMLYSVTSIIFAFLLFAFFRIYKNKYYMLFSFILLIFNLIFLGKMFLYFDKLL
jgi:phosphatidylglycerophosphatase A